MGELEKPDDTLDSWGCREESLFGREKSWVEGMVKKTQ